LSARKSRIENSCRVGWQLFLFYVVYGGVGRIYKSKRKIGSTRKVGGLKMSRRNAEILYDCKEMLIIAVTITNSFCHLD
ncbi:hypothetical protein, partial [Bacteroides heparinolyticus]|uniref:hypothetical protein n=1 Tax=Prevotella heparinolytica TaxID=28113 RepID=UPI00359FA092